MKNILFIITLFVSVSVNAQHTKKYYERLNSNGTIDSGYVKLFTDSVFAYSDNTFVSFTVEYYQKIFGAVMPNQFGSFHLDADGIYRNKVPRAEAVDWTLVGNKPLSFAPSAHNHAASEISDGTTTGRNILTLATPASTSLLRLNSNGTVATRTVAEAKGDLNIDNIDNTSDVNKPVSTAQQTALNLKQNSLGFTAVPDTRTVNGQALSGNITILSNVDNTSDANKPVSTATQTALNLKANLASPAFTGTPTGIGLPVYARVTGSNATTTGQALVDIAGLSVPLTTNAVYEFVVIMSVSTSAVTTGTQYGINYSVAGGTIEAQISGSLTSTATKTERINALNTASTAFLTTSGQTGGMIIRGIVTTGANAGNLTVKHLKNTSGTSTIFINSFLSVTKIQ